MAQITRQPVIACGYVIADTQGLVQLHTLRSTPHQCWQALCGDIYSRRLREMWKRRGFRCVFVWVKESEKR